MTKLETCKSDLADLEQDLRSLQTAESACVSVDIEPLDVCLHASADLETERDRLGTALDERIAFARAQVDDLPSPRFED